MRQAILSDQPLGKQASVSWLVEGIAIEDAQWVLQEVKDIFY
jgi:hypothetical protein